LEGGNLMIFQEIKNMLVNREYAEIDSKILGELMAACNVVSVAGQHGEYLPDEYVELRDWVYDRVAKNLTYNNTGYINEHFCVGAIWGMLRLCDETLFVTEWPHYFKED
jgi:hypothetical protein